MVESGVVQVQYVFLDVVKFTQDRTVEAQVDIIEALNKIVTDVLSQFSLEPDSRILLPTGDGICISILKSDLFDLSLKIALNILKDLATHNTSTEDQRRKFEVRIGINQNIDNLVIDVNGNQNVAGRGINMAQRIMSLADGGQILVGSSVYETICEREAYSNSFNNFKGQDKHVNQFKFYQFIDKNACGLNNH